MEYFFSEKSLEQQNSPDNQIHCSLQDDNKNGLPANQAFRYPTNS